MNAAEEQAQLEALASNLGQMVLKGLGQRSRWALRTTLDAARTDGIAGVCVLRIGTREKDFTDITFTVGSVEITHHWKSAG